MTASLGFRVAILSLIDESDTTAPMVRVAQAGLSAEQWERLRGGRRTLADIQRLTQPEYQLAGSYYIPLATRLLQGQVFYRPDLPDDGGPGAWHPDDMFMAPLRARPGELSGMLAVDEPQDGRAPSQASAETLEIFANMAALAIEDAARYEREQAQTRALTRRNAELAAVLHVGNTLRSGLPLQDVLQQVAEGVTTSLGFRAAIVSLVDEEGGAAAGAAGGERRLARRRMGTPQSGARLLAVADRADAAAVPIEPVLLYPPHRRAGLERQLLSARPAGRCRPRRMAPRRPVCGAAARARRAAARPAGRR